MAERATYSDVALGLRGYVTSGMQLTDRNLCLTVTSGRLGVLTHCLSPAAVVTGTAMFVYLGRLKLPDGGLAWGPGFGCVCVAWVFLFPFAGLVMWVGKGLKEFYHPDEPPPPTCLSVRARVVVYPA